MAHIRFSQYPRNNHSLWYVQAASENSRKQGKRELCALLCNPRERMFPLFMLRRIHLSVTLKWPWLGGFQLPVFTLLNETPESIFRLQWKRKEGLDKMLQTGERRGFVALTLPTWKAFSVMLVYVCRSCCIWQSCSLRFGIFLVLQRVQRVHGIQILVDDGPQSLTLSSPPRLSSSCPVLCSCHTTPSHWDTGSSQ